MNKSKWISIIFIPLLALFIISMLFIFSIGTALLSLFTDNQSQMYGGIFLGPIGEKEIPAEFIPIYQRAAKEYGLEPWLLLPSIHQIETTFSTNVQDSKVGALGHMQFMPCTWVGQNYPSCSKLKKGDSDLVNPTVIEKYKGYGVDANRDGRADPFDIEDAIFAAAKYLSAHMNRDGLYTDPLRNAIYAYNHADWYVNDVMNNLNLYSSGYIAKENSYIPTSMIGDTAWPVPHTKNITSNYGMRSGKMHYGIDINQAGDADLGKPIIAFKAGTVEFAGENGNGYGRHVKIQHGNGFLTLYGHLDSIHVREGQQVIAGQVIGTMGHTGSVWSSNGGKGTHLHFEVRVNGQKTDPRPYLTPWLGS